MRTDRFAFAVVLCSVLLAISVAGCRRRSVRGDVASGGGAGGGAVSVGGEVAHGTPREMLDQFDSRAFGAMLLVFGLLNCLPLPPGSSTILSLPILLLAPQIAVGREVPWLPRKLVEHPLKRDDLRGLFRVPDHRSGLAQIAAWNPGAWLLLTRGEAGATLYHGVQECSGRPPGVEVVDTVGAGDAATAGLLDSLMRNAGAPIEQHLRWALAAGAAACTASGFAPPKPGLVAALAEAVEIA